LARWRFEPSRFASGKAFLLRRNNEKIPPDAKIFDLNEKHREANVIIFVAVVRATRLAALVAGRRGARPAGVALAHVHPL
jgi:hypothetical protein